jgi:ribosome maturation factor RimP
MTEPGRIEELIAPTLEGMGYALVRVQLSGGTASARLQVMAERFDGAAMTVEDCAAISRAISPVLDVADPIAGAYTLEVSSPGIDRPLVRPADFDRFAGFEAKLESARPVDGRRRFRGRLGGTADGAVRIVTEGTEYKVPLADVQKARLVITDELLAASAAGRDRTGQ